MCISPQITPLVSVRFADTSDSRVWIIINLQTPSQLAGAIPMSTLDGAEVEATDRNSLFESEFIFVFVNVIDCLTEILCLSLS